MGLSNNIEPDPEFNDLTLDIELRREIFRKEVLRYIQDGVFSARRILRKLYDPDDPIFTKRVITELIREVQQEIINSYRSRSVLDDVVAYLEQNEEMIIRSNQLIDNSIKQSDQISAINTVNGLWRDRMKFLKDLGADFAKALGPETPSNNNSPTSKRDKMLAALHAEGDAIEAEYVEVKEQT